jgi:dTDP-D-glucose 4,6-dehydratase
LKPNDTIDNWIEYIEDRNFNDYRYAINSNALRELGWKEEIDFEKGFQHTIDWYLKKND